MFRSVTPEESRQLKCLGVLYPRGVPRTSCSHGGETQSHETGKQLFNCIELFNGTELVNGTELFNGTELLKGTSLSGTKLFHGTWYII